MAQIKSKVNSLIIRATGTTASVQRLGNGKFADYAKTEAKAAEKAEAKAVNETTENKTKGKAQANKSTTKKDKAEIEEL